MTRPALPWGLPASLPSHHPGLIRKTGTCGREDSGLPPQWARPQPPPQALSPERSHCASAWDHQAPLPGGLDRAGRLGGRRRLPRGWGRGRRAEGRTRASAGCAEKPERHTRRRPSQGDLRCLSCAGTIFTRKPPSAGPGRPRGSQQREAPRAAPAQWVCRWAQAGLEQPLPRAQGPAHPRQSHALGPICASQNPETSILGVRLGAGIRGGLCDHGPVTVAAVSQALGAWHTARMITHKHHVRRRRAAVPLYRWTD